jgi:hemoglobin
MRNVQVALDVAASLFDRIGGRPQIAWIVDDFCRRLFADEDLAASFADIDVPAFRLAQTAFFTAALGGPDRTVAPQPAPASHPDLWLEPEPFARVALHLWNALLSLDVDDELKELVVMAVVRRALDVAGHGDTPTDMSA